jgi:exopolysaccharide biosynthesis protein
MKIKRRKRGCLLWGLISLVVLVGLCFGGYTIYDRGRPAPVSVKRELYEGITYRRKVYYLPRIVIAHVLVIDTKTSGLKFLVTPPDNAEGDPLNARTTSQFLQEFGAQVAINGDGFSPWWSRSPLDYYPHPGDPVIPNGFAASGGQVYSEGDPTHPTLYISRRNAFSFNRRPGNLDQALSGDRMLLLKGEPVEGLDDSDREPRTAIGLNQNGRWLYIVVVDGRQPFYSEGATLSELADIMKAYGAYQAMNLDGGGSSTMVIEGSDDQPKILNSPIDHYIPRTERPVGNHLGIFVE